MSLIVATIIAFAYLEWPWRGLLILGAAGIEVLELLLWLRLRRMRSITGVEGLIGSHGRAVSDCDPEGQVRVKGQLWRARCEPGVRAGAHVTVTGINGLRLDVQERALHGTSRTDGSEEAV